MSKLDVSMQNTIPTNFKNIDSNFNELYNNSITSITLDGQELAENNSVELTTIQNSDIDTLFSI